MLADVGTTVATVVSPILALIVGALGAALTARARERRKGSTDVMTMMREHDETLYGRKPTRSDPEPPPGLVEQVAEIHTMVGRIIDKVTPNGGDTRESGDLLLLIAKKLDIDVPERTPDEG